ncbi:MAG: SpoIID/LytB domain protein [Eubacterium sp.]|nr:SpoIID/LytB domain protein [Eubacterium sp.]
MKKICLLLSIVLLFTMFSGINYNDVYAASNPIVKIGLYYGSTAQSQIAISADNGVSYNAYDAETSTYSTVYNSGPGQVVNIRKDSYFTGSEVKLTPVASTAGPTIGPYHIKLQSTYNTYDNTIKVISTYKTKGITAYPVYTDAGWEIWTGFYIDQATAQAAITEVKGNLGQVACSVVDKVDTRICAVDSNTGEIIFMYAAAQKLMRGKPAADEDAIIIGTGKLNTFRGQVEFFRKTGSDMTIINVLPMEEYLYGVVPNEIEAFSNPEALKAQAIAARTYSYVYLNKHAAYGFNLCSTTDCHVYKGKSSESPITNKAVDDTKDMVVTYNGKLAETLYFSSSGGMTEDSVNVWGSDIAYLKSVEDKYESGKSYKYNWTLTFTADDLSQKLKNYNLGTVTGMEITKKSEAGRPIEIVVKGTLKPEGVKITRDKCRTFLSLYSQWFTISTNADVNIEVNGEEQKAPLSQVKVVTKDGETKISDPGEKVTIVGADGKNTTVSAVPTEYYFAGKGWGHAVGMSQEGAKGMADAGFTYDQILAHYYQGTAIELKR